MRNYILCISAIIAASNMLAAQTLSTEYDRISRSNFWNEGTNVAGLREASTNVSNATLYSGLTAGGFKDSYMSESQWNIGLGAKTITHLKRFSMIGAFSFENTEANNMCGSMFIRPGFYPVDVMEFTPGRKTFQRYALNGGISVDLDSDWRLGALIDYKSSNASKRKDLRYSSYSMDLRFAPAIMYKSDELALGLSFILKRNTETIDAEQIGTAQNAPFAFFDEGLMIGNYQAWTGSGTRLKEAGVSGLPLQRNSYGIGIQAAGDAWYIDISVSLFRGNAGERQINWYRYSGLELSGLLGIRLDAHSLRLRSDLERLANRETVFDKVVSGGLTRVEEYGSNLLTQRLVWNTRAEYEYLSSGLELRAAAFANLRQILTAPMYPFVYSQDLRIFGVDASCLAHIGDLDCGLELSYKQGGQSSGSSKLIDAVAEEPFRLEDYYFIANEYLTAPRVDASLAFRYNFARGIYAELDAQLTKAFDLKYIAASSRYGLCLALGYMF